jgi:hypothetical protein
MNRKLSLKMGLTKTALSALAVFVFAGAPAAAQQSLKSLAEEYGADWLAGRWTATTEDGTEIVLMYRWALDGHAVVVDFRMGQYASHGMIYYVPDDEHATAISVDNRGGRSKGTWEVRGYNLVSKNQRIDAEGNVRKSGAVYSKVDNRTIKIALYPLNEYDELTDEPWFTTEFKRQPLNTKKKTDK